MEAEEEVPPKTTLPDQFFQGILRGRDDPGPGATGPLPSNRIELPFFEDP